MGAKWLTPEKMVTLLPEMARFKMLGTDIQIDGLLVLGSRKRDSIHEAIGFCISLINTSRTI